MTQVQKLNKLIGNNVIVTSNAGSIKGKLTKVVTLKRQVYQVEHNASMIEFAFYDTKAINGNIITLK